MYLTGPVVSKNHTVVVLAKVKPTRLASAAPGAPASTLELIGPLELTRPLLGVKALRPVADMAKSAGPLPRS